MLDPFAVHHPHHSTNGMGVSRRSCLLQLSHIEFVSPTATFGMSSAGNSLSRMDCRHALPFPGVVSFLSLPGPVCFHLVAYYCRTANYVSSRTYIVHRRLLVSGRISTVALSHCRTVAYPLSPCGYIHIIMGSLRGHGLVQVAFQRPYLLEILLQSSLCIMEKSSRFLMRRPASRASIGRPIRICEPRWRLIPAHGCRYLLRFPRM